MNRWQCCHRSNKKKGFKIERVLLKLKQKMIEIEIEDEVISVVFPVSR
jgi:hypothetical protein